MVHEIRALSICYKLLSRMPRRAQLAAMDWLESRLAEDNERSHKVRAGLTANDRKAITAAVGEAAISMISLLHATGVASGRRTVELRGPLDADVTVRVQKLNSN